MRTRKLVWLIGAVLAVAAVAMVALPGRSDGIDSAVMAAGRQQLVGVPAAPRQDSGTSVATEPAEPDQSQELATEAVEPDQPPSLATESVEPDQPPAVATEPAAPDQSQELATEPAEPDQSQELATEEAAPADTPVPVVTVVAIGATDVLTEPGPVGGTDVLTEPGPVGGTDVLTEPGPVGGTDVLTEPGPVGGNGVLTETGPVGGSGVLTETGPTDGGTAPESERGGGGTATGGPGSGAAGTAEPAGAGSAGGAAGKPKPTGAGAGGAGVEKPRPQGADAGSSTGTGTGQAPIAAPAGAPAPAASAAAPSAAGVSAPRSASACVRTVRRLAGVYSLVRPDQFGALQKAITGDSLLPASAVYSVSYAGVLYYAQRAADEAGGARRVYYVPAGGQDSARSFEPGAAAGGELQAALSTELAVDQELRLDATAALQQLITQAGLAPGSNEFSVMCNGQLYAAQQAYDPATGAGLIYYMQDGDPSSVAIVELP